jgi:uncharacterized membrane protein YbhN (UPF0104 family)
VSEPASIEVVGSARRRPAPLSGLFAGAADEPRSRRATDVIWLVGCVLALGLVGALVAPPPGIERRFVRFIAGVPSSFQGVWHVLGGALSIAVLMLLVAILFARRWAVLRDVAIAGIATVAISLVFSRIAVGAWPSTPNPLYASPDPVTIPPFALAAAAAIVATASPHLSRPARRGGRWLIAFAVLGSVLGLGATVTSAASAILVAIATAAAVHLLFGSCEGRPSLDHIADALAALQVDAHRLSVAERQRTGLFTVTAVDAVGRPLIIKVYGRDAHDTRLLSTLWRAVWYRRTGPARVVGRLQQAEHEAFLTLLVQQSGVRTQEVVVAGATPVNDVLLVLRDVDRPTRRWDADTIARAWHAVGILHGTNVAHGELDADHLLPLDDDVAVVDFRSSTAAPQAEQVHNDNAQLLVTIATETDPDTAVGAALTALGADGLAAALPFVQPPALTAGQVASARAAGIDLDALRTRAAERSGTSAPELQKMRRVTARSVLQVALLVGAFIAVAAVVGALDFSKIFEQLEDATWWLVIAAVLIGQVPRFTQALSVLSASPLPLPLGPTYALQLATSYITLAIPTTAARVAVSIRFLQRHGLTATTALAVGVVDAIVEFLVQVLLVAGLLVLTPATLHLDLGESTPSGLTTLIWIVAGAALAAVLVVVFVPKLRRAVSTWLTRIGRSATEVIRELRSPRRVGQLIGVNIASEILLAFTLQTLARALGYHVGFAEVLLITVSVRVIAGIVPIPGGIGVAEGGLAFGLVRAGLPEEAAFAAVVLYRLATFYVPPVWGFFALRWLERNKHL